MDNDIKASDITGKKIFFLFPTPVMQNRIIFELVQHEYEIYMTRNKDTLRRVLRDYPDSIVFVDINQQMPEKEWETWILAVMNAPDTKTVSIGIITDNHEDELRQKYLQNIKVAAGYTVLKFDLDKSIKQIVDVLQIMGAKGRRKFIRATLDDDSHATVNLPLEGAFINGRIKDISVVGISFTLEGNPEIAKNALVKDVQIILQTSRIKVEGIVFGSRMDGKEKIYVLLFAQRTDSEVRAKIRKYIQHTLQVKMDAELR
ncbi:MAG: PilZ domain-containing protein [Treponema sp.]|nr:PilZ domain-containing protein [Treponema sp.]